MFAIVYSLISQKDSTQWTEMLKLQHKANTLLCLGGLVIR